MNNIFNTNKFLHHRFDLKGSKVGREVKVNHAHGGNSEAVLKDVNFDQILSKVYISPDQKAALMSVLRRDVAFLVEQDIMDQSLLLGYHHRNLDSNYLPIRVQKRAQDKDKSLREGSEYVYITPELANGPLLRSERSEISVPGEDEKHKQPSLRSLFEHGVNAYNDPDSPRAEVYFVGIVDILQQYNLKKQMESTFKGLRSIDIYIAYPILDLISHIYHHSCIVSLQ